MSDTAFRLSRVYAEGWRAARALSSQERDVLKPAGLATLNPYAAEPERSRWSEGFTKAIAS